MRAAWIEAGVAAAVLAALYLLMAGSVSADEIGAAVVLGLSGGAWMLVARLASGAPLAMPPRAAGYGVAAMARLFPRTLGAVARLVVAMGSGRSGEIRRRDFHRGRLDAPEDAGRRAAVVLALSLSPDSIVLHAPLTEDVLEVHDLGVGKPRGDARWPA